MPGLLEQQMSAMVKLRILYGEADNAFEHIQALRGAGYDVTGASGREGVQEALVRAPFDVVILGHTFARDDRHHLPYLVKKLNPEIRLLVLHASGHHPKVDVALDSRLGPEVLLRALADLSLQPVGS